LKYIISGATGVLGYALVRHILKQGNELSILARSEDSLSNIFNEFGRHSISSVEYLELNEYSDSNISLKGDVFIHLAWAGVQRELRNNVEKQAENIVYTLDAISLAKKAGCKIFVGAGSQAEFAETNSPMGINTPTIPRDAYGAAKLAAGQFGRIFAESMKIRFYWFRVFSIFGPYDRPYSFMYNVIEKFINHKTLNMTNGNQIWDYLFSYDAAELILRIIRSNNYLTYISLGSGYGIPLNEHIIKVKRILRSNSLINRSIEHIPESRKYLVADLSEINKIIPNYQFTSMENAIEILLKDDKRITT
jgi:UDP-glucose 4-epimerase